MSERLRARQQADAYRDWRKHVGKCAICSVTKPDPQTADGKTLCELGRKLRAAWKEPK